MAHASTSQVNGCFDIKNALTCIICKGGNTSNLIQLDCFHSCHRHCVRTAIPGSRFSCPQCKVPSLVPYDSIRGFPKELLQFKMKDIDEIFANNSFPCNVCEMIEKDNISTHFCMTCRKYLCTADNRRHSAFPEHQVIPNSEIQKEQHLSQIISSQNAVCTIHSTASSAFVLDFYCEQCQIPACQICCNTFHKRHNTVLIQEASSKPKGVLQEKATKVKNLSIQCKFVVGELEKLQNQVEMHNKNQIQKCIILGQDVKEIVDKIVKENVQNIESVTRIQKNKMQELSEQKNDQNKHFQSADNYMDIFLRFGSGSDCLQKSKIYNKSLQKCLQQEVAINIDTTLFEVDLNNIREMEITLKEMLKVETIYENHHIKTPRLMSCDLESKWSLEQLVYGVAVDGEEIIALGRKIEVYEMNGNRIRQIRVHGLRDAYDIEVFDKKIYVSDGHQQKREILVTNKMGNIERKISVPTEEREGCSAAIGLAVDPIKEDCYISSAGNNVVYQCCKGQNQATPFISDGLNMPEYLCVTPDHGVIVANNGSHKVSKFNSEGIQVWEYGKEGAGEEELNGPQGVCVDPWGYVFVCDYGNDRIHYLSPEGEFLSFIEIGEKIKCPRAIKFKGQKIIIVTQERDEIFVIKCRYH